MLDRAEILELFDKDKEDLLEAGLEGRQGDDALYGGVGNDILFDMGGDDYLYGGRDLDARDKHIGAKDGGKDILFGGSGTDILLAGKSAVNGTGENGAPRAALNVLLNDGDGKGTMPVVGGVEVLLRSDDTDYVENLGITSHASLAKYGVRIEQHAILLCDAWGAARHYDGILEYTYQDPVHGQLTLQIKAPEVEDGKYNYAIAGGLPASEFDKDFDVTLGTDNGDLLLRTSSAPTEDGAAESQADHSILYGGAGNDHLDGGADDDYLFGGEGMDALLGGAGDDLIVYDGHDALIDGGTGVDFLPAADDGTEEFKDLHLHTLLEATGHHQVRDVEVLLKGVDALSLTSLPDLADLGITVENGIVTLTGWEQAKGDPATATVADKEVTVTTYTNGDLTLETTLDTDHIVLQAQLQNGNA